MIADEDNDRRGQGLQGTTLVRHSSKVRERRESEVLGVRGKGSVLLHRTGWLVLGEVAQGDSHVQGSAQRQLGLVHLQGRGSTQQ